MDLHQRQEGSYQTTIEGLPVDEFIARNADPIWLHQNEMWEYIQPEPSLFADEDEVNAAFDAASE